MCVPTRYGGRGRVKKTLEIVPRLVRERKGNIKKNTRILQAFLIIPTAMTPAMGRVGSKRAGLLFQKRGKKSQTCIRNITLDPLTRNGNLSL